MNSLWQDIRYALRQLRKNPGFTVVAVLTLAIGIGANAAIFSITYALLLRQLPVPNPQRIVRVVFSTSNLSMAPMSGPMFDAITKDQSAFTGTCGWTGASLKPSEGGETREVLGAYATGNCFSTLEILPALGRLLNASDDQPGGGPYGWQAMISYDYWRTHYGGDPNILGHSLVVNGQPVSVAGVLPDGFHGLFLGNNPAIVVPSEFEMVSDKFQMRHNTGSFYLQTFARLKPGMDRRQAEAQLQALQPAILKQAFSAEQLGNHIDNAVCITVEPGATGWGFIRRFMTLPLLVLHALAGILLLVICMDVGLLISARNATRRHELAIRSALGAGRARIVWQLFLENLLIGCVGAGTGIALATTLDRLLLTILIRPDLPLTLDLGAGWAVLVFTASVALLAVIVFGMLPALRASKLDASSELKVGGGFQISARKTRMSKWLVPAQIALSVILVVVGSLFSNSFIRLIKQNPGFRTEGVLLAPVDFNQRVEKGAALAALYRGMLDRLATMPGIEQASFSELTPLNGSSNSRDLASTNAEGQPNSIENVLFNNVAPNYFRTIGTSVLAGREFESADFSTSQRVCVLSHAAARHLFPGQDPLGQRVVPNDARRAADGWTVIGVVEDIRSQNLRSADRPTVYFNALQSPDVVSFPTFVIRTKDIALASRQFRQLLRETAPDTPLLPAVTFREQMESNVVPEKLLAFLVGSFSAIALFLSAITLYGLLAYNVVWRTPEIGLRLALGGQRAQIVSLFMREALRLVVPGVIVGTALALLAGRGIRSLLYGISPWNPWMLAFALAVTLATALFATLIPARRAAKVDPMVALRYE